MMSIVLPAVIFLAVTLAAAGVLLPLSNRQGRKRLDAVVGEHEQEDAGR